MSSNSNIIRLLQLLEDETNENSIFSMPQIQERLKAVGIDRMTLGEQIQTLLDCGYDISTYAENRKGYFFTHAQICGLWDSLFD